MTKKKITAIPVKRTPVNVGIYCRVSSSKKQQLHSLAAQISGLTQMVASDPQWHIKDIYIDVASGSTVTDRMQFSRLLEDCKSGKINLIVVGSVSRFARDTVDALDAIHTIHKASARVYFYDNNIFSDEPGFDLDFSIYSALAQSENESRSMNSRMGIKYRAMSGQLKSLDKKAYGYKHDENGHLCINETEAKTVGHIFDLYLNGQSVLGIIKTLAAENIPSPRKNKTWSKGSIINILKSEKYIGNAVISLKDGTESRHEGHHPAIIDLGIFKAAQAEMKRRSNVETSTDGVRTRKSTRYSSKR